MAANENFSGGGFAADKDPEELFCLKWNDFTVSTKLLELLIYIIYLNNYLSAKKQCFVVSNQFSARKIFYITAVSLLSLLDLIPFWW